MEASEAIKSKLEQIENQIRVIIECWEQLVTYLDEPGGWDEDSLDIWRAVKEKVKECEKQHELFMDIQGEVREQLAKIAAMEG